MKYYYDLKQGSNEWLHARLGIITASQVGRLITPTGKIAKNDDSRSIVYEKVAERITNRIEEGFCNSHMERGNMFEPFARDLYAKEIAPVKECGFITEVCDKVTIGYSPDGLVGDDGLIEIKCPARTKHVKEICEGKEPTAYMMQIQTGLLVTGRKWCDYIAHHNGMKQRIVRILPDPEIHALIIEAVKSFDTRLHECIAIYYDKTEDMPLANFEEEYLV